MTAGNDAVATIFISFFSFFFSFFHSVSDFVGFRLANAMGSGSGSDIPLIQDIEPSNGRAHLNHATLRFFSLAEQCHTQIFISGVSSRILML